MAAETEAAPATRDRSRWLERGLALASLGTAVAYVALRGASTLFYDALGVTPEELGLGEFELLARSVGLLVIVFAVSATVAALVAWVVVLMATLGVWDSVVAPLLNQLYRAPGWYQGVVLAAGAVAFGVGLWRQSLLEFAPVVIFPAGGWIGYRLWRGVEPWPEGLGPQARRHWRRLRTLFGAVWRPATAVAAGLSLAATAAAVTTTANLAAASVRTGHAYRDPTVPWRAEPAAVRWLAPPATDPLAGRCLMYLGQSDANLVLYDAGSHSIVRVPSTAAVLVLDTGASSCSPD